MNTQTDIDTYQSRKQAYILRLAQLVTLILFVILCSAFSYAGIIEDIQILKIVPKDERAIIKMPDGETKIIKVGDLIEENIMVTEISQGRVIFEEKTKTGVEKVLVEIDESPEGKAKDTGSKGQKVIRIKKSPDKQEMLYKAK